MGPLSVGGERGSGVVATTDGVGSMESWACAMVGSVACSVDETSISAAIALVVLMGNIGWGVAFAGTLIVK